MADWRRISILLDTSSARSNTNETSASLYIIDWEFAQYGHRAYDMGQMIGDLLEKNHFAPSRTLQDLVEGFARGYGAITDEIAFRVAIHVGVHMINWCSRHAPLQEEEFVPVEKLLEEALNLVVNGCRSNRQWFEKCMLSCLFS